MNRELHTLTSYDARARLDELVDLYLEVYRGSNDPFFGEERYRKQLNGHMTAAGWQMVCAEIDGELVAYIYGFPLLQISRWWNGLLDKSDAGFSREDGTRTFAISELLVRDDVRKKGVATALHDHLLAGRNEQRATLLVEPSNVVARAAYEKWGWRQVNRLHPDWGETPAPTYDVMILDLTTA